MVAAYRARASQRDDAICHDPWAEALAGPAGFDIAARYDQYSPYCELWMGVRTAQIDHWVHRFNDPPHGFGQVVLLGAGLDTRAARLARVGVRYFEVDHPHTQAEKRTRLAALETYPTENITFVPCDFEHDNVWEQLRQAGWKTDVATFFIWEGVVPYLSEESVRATLTGMAETAHPRSVIVFDTISRHLVNQKSNRPMDRELVKFVEDLGEPFQFGLDDPTPLMSDCGLRHVRRVSFDEACLSLTGTYTRERAFRFQHLVLASSSTPLD